MPQLQTSFRSTTALVVGGGPVGQIVAKALVNAGVDVYLYLKPKYASTADAGFLLYPTPTFKKRTQDRLDDFKIATHHEEFVHIHVDQVYVCVSSVDLRQGDWFPKLWHHMRHAFWIFMTPGIGDRAYAAKVVPERYLVMGVVGFLAYDAPLPGEFVTMPGTAVWYVPMSATLVQGPDEESTAAIAKMLHSGGMPAQVSTHFEADRLFSNGLWLPLIATLETRGWSFDSLREDKAAIARLCVATAELSNAIRSRTGRSSRLANYLKKPWFWRFVLKRAPRWIPFPIDKYLRKRYTKLRPEMELLLREYATFIQRTGSSPHAFADIAREWTQGRPKLQYDAVDMTPAGMVVGSSIGVPGVQMNSGSQSGSFPASQSGNFPASQSGNFPASQSGNMPAAQSGNFQRPLSGNYQQPNSGNFQAPNSGNFQQPQTGGYQQPPQGGGYPGHHLGEDTEPPMVADPTLPPHSRDE